jgi:hypothetical protein
MYFLARDEARLLEKKLRRQIDEQPKPKLVLYYDSGARDYSEAANTIAASIGKFTEATLIFLFCVTGDGWTEEAATNERWRRYRRWRGASNESRRLYDAPGHQFEPHEAEQLSKVIDFALKAETSASVALPR